MHALILFREICISHLVMSPAIFESLSPMCLGAVMGLKDSKARRTDTSPVPRELTAWWCFAQGENSQDTLTLKLFACSLSSNLIHPLKCYLWHANKKLKTRQKPLKTNKQQTSHYHHQNPNKLQAEFFSKSKAFTDYIIFFQYAI